jgi:hypothetical protein
MDAIVTIVVEDHIGMETLHLFGTTERDFQDGDGRIIHTFMIGTETHTHIQFGIGKR